MSQNIDNYRELFSKLSTEELEAFLKKDYDSGTTGNEEVILAILDILMQREGTNFVGKSTDQSWAEFQKYYNTPEGVGRSLYPTEEAEQQNAIRQKKTRSWWRHGVAVAAVVALLIVAVPYAIGSESVFTKVGKWTATYFSFFHPDVPATEPVFTFHSENEALVQAYRDVSSLGVEVPLVPAWLPEELFLTESKITEYPGFTMYYARFASDQYEVIITFDVSDTLPTRQFQKDNVDPEELEVGGVKHYLVPNDGYWNAIWVNGDIVGAISTNYDKDTLIWIVQSIYSGGY